MGAVLPFAGKTRLAVKDALNGDYEQVDPAVRRGLFAIAQELDEHAEASAARHDEILVELDTRATRIEKSLSRVQALLITATLTFFTTLVTGVVGMLLN